MMVPVNPYRGSPSPFINGSQAARPTKAAGMARNTPTPGIPLSQAPLHLADAATPPNSSAPDSLTLRCVARLASAWQDVRAECGLMAAVGMAAVAALPCLVFLVSLFLAESIINLAKGIAAQRRPSPAPHESHLPNAASCNQPHAHRPASDSWTQLRPVPRNVVVPPLTAASGALSAGILVTPTEPFHRYRQHGVTVAAPVVMATEAATSGPPSPMAPRLSQSDLADAWTFLGLDPSDHLGAYVSHGGLERDLDAVRTWVDEGRLLVRQLTLAPACEVSPAVAAAQLARDSPVAAQRQAVSLLWYLMERATREGQGFQEGAFVCVDPGFKVGRYLQGLGYDRSSSHLQALPGPTVGIDISSRELTLPNLRHRHVLCRLVTAPDGEERLFIKPESHGVRGMMSLALHALDYLRSLGRKQWPSLFGRDDMPQMRKERIPRHLIEEFKWFMEGYADCENQLRRVGSTSCGEGLAFMFDSLNALLQGNREMPPGEAAALSSYRDRLNSIDNITRRVGNEVIITSLS